MDQVKIDKEKLIGILKENRKIHVEEYKEAKEKYKTALIKEVEELLKKVKKNPLKTPIGSKLSKPEDHSRDFDLAIEMLEMEVEDSVILRDGQFQQLVQNNWHWRGRHTANYMSLTGKSSKLS